MLACICTICANFELAQLVGTASVLQLGSLLLQESLPRFGLEEHDSKEATQLKPLVPLEKRATGDLADAQPLNEEKIEEIASCSLL